MGYNEIMVIAPGYPKDNVILTGLVSILRGQDPEQVIAERDEKLPSADLFVPSAVEAACWIDEPALLEDLFEQIEAAMKHLDESSREQTLGRIRRLSGKHARLAELSRRLEGK